jgi:2-C-methyl-D-erythritol 4-phosphate cytidylyltransferase
MRALAIIVAAGRGERMGTGRPKAFLPLGGEPMLLRSARAFAASPCVERVVAVVPASEVASAEGLLSGLARPARAVAGGARRQDSVLEGLKQAPEGFDGVVLVHDAARPFVEPQLIEAVAAAAAEHGASVPLLPVVDTIKRVEDGRVVATVDRDTLGAAQTPQGFRFALLVRAYEDAFRAGVSVTDECMAVERLRAPIAAVKGSARNRKLTTPEDMAWAESLVREEERA